MSRGEGAEARSGYINDHHCVRQWDTFAHWIMRMASAQYMSADTDPSRSIPEGIKREVRKACYFGCVICGLPVWHYDHIDGWAQVQKHDPLRIALLCPTHHQDKTSGRLSSSRIGAARQKPANEGRLFTKGHALERTPEIKITVGACTFLHTLQHGDQHCVLWVNGLGSIVLHREDSGYCISAYVTDAEGQALLILRQGELRVSTDIFDFRYEGTRLRVWSVARGAILDISLSDENFDVSEGWFLDPHLDGFKARPGKLEVFQEGRPIGMTFLGTTFSNNAGHDIARFNGRVLGNQNYPDGSAIVAVNQW